MIMFYTISSYVYGIPKYSCMYKIFVYTYIKFLITNNKI